MQTILSCTCHSVTGCGYGRISPDGQFVAVEFHPHPPIITRACSAAMHGFLCIPASHDENAITRRIGGKTTPRPGRRLAELHRRWRRISRQIGLSVVQCTDGSSMKYTNHLHLSQLAYSTSQTLRHSKTQISYLQPTDFYFCVIFCCNLPEYLY